MTKRAMEKTNMKLTCGSKILLIIVFSVMGIVLVGGCINEEKTKEEPGDEIQNIGEAVPQGWNYTIITQNVENIERPQGIWEPVAIAIMDFTNFNKEIGHDAGMKTNMNYYPSLRLYFYNATEKQEILEIMDKEKMHSNCIPIYFSETKRYIIMTSPCYINSETFSEDARHYYSKLEKPLKEYFDRYNKSVERSLTIIEKVELSEDEKARQSDLIENIPKEIRQEFNTKYETWKETWDDPKLKYVSNPKMFTQSRQYEEFLSFCKEQGKTILPLLFERYEQEDEFAGMTIVDLTYNEYGYILDEIRQESARERYTAEGADVIPSGNAIGMKYIKRLLALI